MENQKHRQSFPIYIKVKNLKLECLNLKNSYCTSNVSIPTSLSTQVHNTIITVQIQQRGQW